jgi:hypothetical protein
VVFPDTPVSSTNKTDRHDLKEFINKTKNNKYHTVRKVRKSNEKCIERDKINTPYTGADPGGAHPARAHPKIGKNMIFWRKIVIFHTKYLKIFRASLRNWKKYDFFWRKIVIFHTKYPSKFRASLR